MGRRGNPYDNAKAESFIKTLKVEAVYLMDYETFVEGQSVLERELRGDPAGIYPYMTFEARDRYRHVIERIAKRTGMEEAAVASRAVALSDAEADERAVTWGSGERSGTGQRPANPRGP